MLKLEFEMMKIWFLFLLGKMSARSVNDQIKKSKTDATFEVEAKRKVTEVLIRFTEFKTAGGTHNTRILRTAGAGQK